MINNIFIFIPLSFYLSIFQIIFLLSFFFKTAYVPVKSKLEHPPGQYPGHLNFFFSNSPFTGPKSCSNAPTPGKLPDYSFNFSVAFIMLLKLYMLTWFIRQYIFLYYRCKTPLNTEHSLCRPLVLNQSTTKTQSFPLNSSKFVYVVSPIIY